MEVRALKKLLIVDDDPDILTIAKYALKKDPTLEIRCVSSGHEAIEEAKKFVPDLILLDVMMPKMDGLSTLKNLKTQIKTQHIPVVFFTAKVTQDEIESYIKEDVEDVLIKPFDPAKLLENLQNIWVKYLHKG